MIRPKIFIFFFICTALLFGMEESRMEQEYELVKEFYINRDKDAQKEIRNYLSLFPYTTYADDCYLMSGVVKIEHGSFTQGLKDLDKVDFASLNDDFQNDYLFYHGYAYVMVDNYAKASSDFKQLVKRESPYKNKAEFYLAYCFYRNGEYDKCLIPFSKIENDPLYKNSVPYYIIQILMQQNKNEEVIKKCNEILKSQPENKNNIEIYRILGEMYNKAGKAGEAIENFVKYRKLCQTQKQKPDRNDMYILGKLLYDKKNYEASVDLFKYVCEQKDSLAEFGRFMLGNAYVKLKQLDKAKLSFYATSELNFTPSLQEEALYNYVLCTFMSPNQMGESINAFKLFINKYPHSRFEKQVYDLLGNALMHSNDYEMALSVIDSIPVTGLKIQETKQYLRYQIGTESFINGRYSDADRWFTEIISAASNGKKQDIVSDALYWRAETRYKMKKYVPAVSDLERYFKVCSTKSSNYIKARYLFAYAHYMNKDYDKAKLAFEKYVVLINEDNPAFSDAYNRMADCDFNKRRFSSALPNYKKVINLQTTGSDYAIFQCGYAYGLLRRYDEKENYMTQLQQTYPRSDYADDALYEKARAQIEQQKEEDAIQTYQQLIKSYPKSPLIRKASLETAMLFRNNKDFDNATKWYKQTIERFPRTDESYIALNDLEAIYVENNNIKEYLNYVKGLQKLNMQINNKDDSLTYVTAELQYVVGKYKLALTGFETYLTAFCPAGRYCIDARYYLSDCYYKLNDSVKALNSFIELASIDNNQYMEEACIRVAELAYDTKDYQTALTYFQKMKSIASNSQNVDMANLGILRCCSLLGLNDKTIEIASVILNDASTKLSIREEAYFNRAKALVALKKYQMAIEDLNNLSPNVKTLSGAHAVYMLAECYFYTNNLDESENTIMNFTKQNTPHRYWLAKSLILLADIYTQKNDLFQAQQYLLSLQNNYRQNDEINEIIAQKLKILEDLQKQNANLKNEQ